MACFSMRLPNETPAARDARINAALDRVEKLLAEGTVRIVVGPGGSPALQGWTQDQRERGGALLPDGKTYAGGLTDVCVLRSLTLRGSVVAKAKMLEAEKGSRQRISLTGGVHSHDGGRTWGSH